MTSVTSRRVVLAAAALLAAARMAAGQPSPPESPLVNPDAGLGPFGRIISALERKAILTNRRDPQDGLSLRVGALDEGGRLAIGPMWRYSRLADGRIRLDASAAFSLKGDRELSAGLRLPNLGTQRVALAFTTAVTVLPEEHFYGLGIESRRTHRADFHLARRSVRAAILFRPAPPLTLEASTGLLSVHLGTLGGLDVAGARLKFLRSRVAAAYDGRDRPDHPRRGGRYEVAFERFAGPAEDWTSFNRLETRLEHHFALWAPLHTLTVRALGSASIADEGHDVPFYLMPTLGGARLMRGFEHERFRDRNQVLLQSEYAWDISRTLGAVLFYERGAVAPRLADFRWSAMKSDYGIGLRVGSPRLLELRTDVAFGSGEGTRLVVRLNHLF